MRSVEREPQTQIPAFWLRDTSGREVSSQDLYGRANLAFAFLPEGEGAARETVVRELEALGPALAEWETQIVLIAPGWNGPTSEGAPLRLVDPEGRVAQAILGAPVPRGGCGLVVTDRFLAFLEGWLVEPSEPFPAREVLETARLADSQCPECSVPLPTWRAAMATGG